MKKHKALACRLRHRQDGPTGHQGNSKAFEKT
jgi:hypothetical protein